MNELDTTQQYQIICMGTQESDGLLSREGVVIRTLLCMVDYTIRPSE